MPLSLTPSPPLRTDTEGVVRVGGSRVTLDTVVYAFEDGATAEEIQMQYPSLALTDVYAAITYYLQHRDEVASYLAEREALADRMREKMAASFDQSGIRERLMARMERRGETRDLLSRPEWRKAIRQGKREVTAGTPGKELGELED